VQAANEGERRGLAVERRHLVDVGAADPGPLAAAGEHHQPRAVALAGAHEGGAERLGGGGVEGVELRRPVDGDAVHLAALVTVDGVQHRVGGAHRAPGAAAQEGRSGRPRAAGRGRWGWLRMAGGRAVGSADLSRGGEAAQSARRGCARKPLSGQRFGAVPAPPRDCDRRG